MTPSSFSRISLAARACGSDGALITRSRAATRNWFEKTENCCTKWRSSASVASPSLEPARIGVVEDDPVMEQVAIDLVRGSRGTPRPAAA